MNTLKALMVSSNLKSYLNAKIKMYANEKIDHEAFIKLLQSIIKSIESILKKNEFFIERRSMIKKITTVLMNEINV